MRALTMSLAMLLLIATSADGTVVRVPLDQPTIREGVSAASSGDTVLIAPGTYTGPLNTGISFGGKNLVVVSEAGAEVTVIDCEGVGRAFDIDGGETDASIIEGLTITHGYAYSYMDCGGGVRIRGASPTIRNCVFSYCHAEGYWWNHHWPAFGGGIYCEDSASVIVGCTFVGNQLEGEPSSGSAVAHYGPGGAILNCLFAENGAWDAVDVLGSQPIVQHCVSDSPLPQGENNAGEVDPALCGGMAPMAYFPCSDSPALPHVNDWGELVGVFDSGCGPCSTPVETMSWGAVKALYR